MNLRRYYPTNNVQTSAPSLPKHPQSNSQRFSAIAFRERGSRKTRGASLPCNIVSRNLAGKKCKRTIRGRDLVVRLTSVTSFPCPLSSTLDVDITTSICYVFDGITNVILSDCRILFHAVHLWVPLRIARWRNRVRKRNGSFDGHSSAEAIAVKSVI